MYYVTKENQDNLVTFDKLNENARKNARAQFLQVEIDAYKRDVETYKTKQIDINKRVNDVYSLRRLANQYKLIMQLKFNLQRLNEMIISNLCMFDAFGNYYRFCEPV